MYRILIADDEKDIREALVEMINLLDLPPNCELEIEQAEDGENAYDQIIKQDFDLLITDLKMPKLEGNDLIAKLTTIREKLPKHVIVLSGFIPAEDNQRQIDNVYFYSKPIPYEDVTNLLEKLIREFS